MAIDHRPPTIDHRLQAIELPRFYPILDFSCFPDDRALIQFAEDLLAAGVILLQYRNKHGSSRQMLSDARELRRLAGPSARLIMNDRADLCLAADCDGVHVGQDDLPPAAVRGIVGNRLWVGVSTHRPEQLREADRSDADYLAIGPVFATTSKANPGPVVGLDGVRAARSLTQKPLVAIGGITRANARSVIEAGADSVAVISDLLRDPRRAVEEFFAVLG
ncbi:MAG: thiamine phosphate synthase [Acidobacteriia bacterium]|nr:thiamine phosphate synthase [Terriglobia bacterium]